MVVDFAAPRNDGVVWRVRARPRTAFRISWSTSNFWRPCLSQTFRLFLRHA